MWNSWAMGQRTSIPPFHQEPSIKFYLTEPWGASLVSRLGNALGVVGLQNKMPKLWTLSATNSAVSVKISSRSCKTAFKSGLSLSFRNVSYFKIFSVKCFWRIMELILMTSSSPAEKKKNAKRFNLAHSKTKDLLNRFRFIL